MPTYYRPKTSYEIEAHKKRPKTSHKKCSRAATSMSRAAGTPQPDEEAHFVPLDKLKVVSSQTQTEIPYPPEPTPVYYPGNMVIPQPRPGTSYHQDPRQYITPQNGYTTDRMLYRQQHEPPKIRCGRVGSSWRHVKQCLGNLGNQIMFIDGVVKTEDINEFPPWGFQTKPKRPDSRNLYYYDPPTVANTISGLPRQRYPSGSLNSKYNQRAKEGYKYWYEEKKPISQPPKVTIQGRCMKLGIGY